MFVELLTFVSAAPGERGSLLWTLWQQTVKPAAMQVLNPQASGSRPVPSCLGAPSGNGLNGGPSGACPHAQARGPEGGRGCCEGQQGRQDGEVWLGHSDAGALQEQDAACHQIGDAQAEQQHLSPLQEAVQLVERRHHPYTVYCLYPQWKAISWITSATICNLLTTS